MKLFKRGLALILIVLLLCPVMAQATGNWEDPRYINNWVVAEYEVSQREIYRDDYVNISVLLYNAADPGIEGLKIAPEASSFNGMYSMDMEEIENGYVHVEFRGVRYMGEGNTFMMRVDGEVLSLTVHECVPDSELPQGTDETTPVLQVGREDQPKAIAEGETQTVKLWVTNLTGHTLDEVVAVVTPSAELQIMDNSVTYPLGWIRPGDVAFFEVSLRAFGEVTSASQSLSVEVSYSYNQSGNVSRGSSTQPVPLSAVVSKEKEPETGITASVPNVIVSNYDYGTEKIYAGTAFDLNLEFKNTSSVKTVENIVMTIQTGESLAITNSSNSFHFPSLAPGSTQTQTLNLQALPDAPTAPAVMTVKFSYEYIDTDERRAVTQEQTVSLPVYQLDRFELTQENSFAEAWQYQESFLTLSYVNKGKSTVYNVSAELQGDIPAMSKTQNIGNVEAGRSGTIDFIITPEMAGEDTCKVVVTYEDDAMQVMQKEFEFEIMVNEMFVPEPMPEEEIMMEEPQPKTGWILPTVLGVIAAGVVVLVVLKKRKKKKSGVVETFVFTDGTEDTDGHS